MSFSRSGARLMAAITAGTVAYQFHPQMLHTMTAQADAAGPANALDPNSFKPFKLQEKLKLTGNTYRFRFELPEDSVAQLPVASCLVTKAILPVEGTPKPVVRPYTPVSPPDAKGYLDLIVKVYPSGVMSKHIGELKIGDALEFKGPIAKYPYEANKKKKIGMVAGGSGITPMLQVVEHICRNPEDKTEVSLIFANVSEDDIILRKRLDELASKHANFNVFYVVDKAKWGGVFWKGGVGYITKDIVKEHLPPPGEDNLIMVCGPPGMMKAVSGDKAPDRTQGELTGLLKDMGYKADMVFKF